MKISIIAFREPYICGSCKKIVNKKCNNCPKMAKKFISGTLIRRLIKKERYSKYLYEKKHFSYIKSSINNLKN